MPEIEQTQPGPVATTQQTALDAAMQKLEVFIAGLEKQQQRAEELAKVPDDIPRFVTRRYSDE